MLRKKIKYFFDLLIVLIFVIFFICLFGNKYLKRLNTFITENNNIIIKNELNKFINNLHDLDFSSFYNLEYNADGEVVDAKYNAQNINRYLSKYTLDFSRNINDIIYSNYIENYFNNISVGKKKYLLVPIGFIYENPFIYNMGPSIFLYYDFINTFTFNLEFDAKNYGMNNILINIYLVVNVDQSIFKPVLKKVSSSKYKFLISSSMVYGRVSNFFASGINMQSPNL